MLRYPSQQGTLATGVARDCGDVGSVAGWPSGRERNGLQPGQGATELGFPRPAPGEMQSEAARRAGDPSHQSEDPPPEDALEEALSKGKPEVFNTDQGSQFTSEAFTGLLEQHGVRVSMDGKGRYTDNLFIERLWRSLKYEEVYLKAYTGGRDARIGIGEYFRFYNTERPHQALEYQTPAEVFISNNHVVTQGNDVQSGNPLTSLEALEAAGPALNMAPILSN